MSKRKLTAAEKKEKARRRALYETVFVGGKQKRVKRREPLIDGVEQDAFILRNADPIWLHQNEMWGCMSGNLGVDATVSQLEFPF